MYPNSIITNDENLPPRLSTDRLLHQVTVFVNFCNQLGNAALMINRSCFTATGQRLRPNKQTANAMAFINNDITVSTWTAIPQAHLTAKVKATHRFQ